MDTSYTAMRRRCVRDTLMTLLILPSVFGVACFLLFDFRAALTVGVTIAVMTLFAAGYRWDADRRQQALTVSPHLENVLWQFYQLERPDAPNSLTLFFKWRGEYTNRHGDALSILTHVRTRGQLPGTHSLRDVPSGDVNHLHQQARMVAA